MSLWQEVERANQNILGRANVWESLGEALRDPQDLPAGGGLWGEIHFLPGGIWQSAREETLVLGRRGANLWRDMNEATLLVRGRRNIWNKINELNFDADKTALWEKVDEETLLLRRASDSVWTKPAVRDLAKVKLQRGEQWALKELKTANGETYWILKHLANPAYLRLTEHELLLWNMLDGSHTVQDLAVENFVQFGTFNVEWLTGFLNQLQQKGFLTDPKADVYQDAREQAMRRSFRYRFFRTIGLIFQSEIGIPVDGFYTQLYRWFGWVLFTRVAQLALLAVTVLGIPAFFIISGSNNVLFSDAGQEALFASSLVSLIAAQIIVFFIHESSHALTTCHYGRHVRRGGVGLYLGMVAFFVDTTDIWMEPRGPRLAVTWAGPYSGFILGGIFSLLLLFFPHMPGSELAYQIAALGYLVSATNLNPLLKFDGYYMLMDWLEIPMLRERSIKFVRSELWTKLRSFQGFSREEGIFALFGLAALVYTFFMILLVLFTFGSSIFDFFHSLLGS